MKNIKMITAGIVMLAISVFMLSYAAFASYDIKILVNGERIETQVTPFIENGSTLIPLRDVFEALEIPVEWNDEKRYAVITNGTDTVEIYPDSGKFIKNGQEMQLSAPPKIVENRIVIPLRAASESFGYNVLWEGESYTVSISRENLLRVHFLDCGQADSIFSELPDGRCMLIDAGESSFGKTLEEYIKERGYSHIDYVVATHPHSDHIGGMAHILDSFSVGTFYMPEKVHTTKTFEKMLDSLDKNGCSRRYIAAGDVLSENPYRITALSPQKKDYIRMNDFSAVLKLVYKNTSVLFSADAEANAEAEMTEGDISLKADVLKIGHHGSPTSTTWKYLSQVNPATAIISVGEENPYGFPSELVLSQLAEFDVNVYRTDIQGTVNMISDGFVYVIE